MIGSVPTLSASEFVAVFNQSLDMIFPEIIISGELANFRISKNRWVYFDLKDELASVSFFGPVSMLPGPLENGMMLEVMGQPRLHNLYGFSINFKTIKVSGEGSIAKAQTLLAKKLELEGLFDQSRKRTIMHPPEKIGLISSVQSAAYADFIKIINARWGNVAIEVADTLVQGIDAPQQIVHAISLFNMMPSQPDVLVLIRGGGRADDLAAFSTEQVVRSVASSRIPTLVAIGHEIDLSLAELAADSRASTPSNAAELLVPSRNEELDRLVRQSNQLNIDWENLYTMASNEIKNNSEHLRARIDVVFNQARDQIIASKQLLGAFSPDMPLRRGYAVVRDSSGALISFHGILHLIYCNFYDTVLIVK